MPVTAYWKCVNRNVGTFLGRSASRWMVFDTFKLIWRWKLVLLQSSCNQLSD